MAFLSLGSAIIDRVEEMTIRSPMSSMTGDQALLKANYHWLKPRYLHDDDTRDFVFQSWVTTIDSKIIVVDPCNGNGRSHPLALFNQLDTPYLERFAQTGLRPQDVDLVFCTHLHHDHCGWSTRLQNGRFVPTFPNARYLYVRQEYERWKNPPELQRAYDLNVGVFEHSVRPIFEAGLAHMVEEGYELTSSCTVLSAPGHTAGHSILHLHSQGHHAFFTGDVFHHPLQLLYPELHMPGDDDLAVAIQTRRRVISRCLQHQALILPAHFPRPYAGYARIQDGGLIFEPVNERP
jgi:glyoxylase-like metal-dependent hydrolase (beta-lactamase superfamily II)